MKKIFNLMLIFVLMLISIVPNVSAVTTATDGSIEISGTIEGKKYKIYQILTLDSYADVDGNGTINEQDGYVYKAPTSGPWKTFVENSTYLEVDAQGYVTWKTGADKVQFAKDALKYAKDNSIAPTVEEKTADASGKVVFNNLTYGYYLVDSSLGALCGLTTTKPNATVIEKNSEPSVTKEVIENSKGKLTDGADTTNTAFIGETITYQIKITVGAGSENYKLYDKMDAGLTYNNDLTVKLNGTTLTKDTDYTIVPNANYTFVIEFKKELKQNDVIVVDYTAELNENAVNGSTGNKNKATLEYGDNHKLESETTTYTYKFQLVKTDDSREPKVLDGAKFRLYDGTGAAAKEIFLVKESEGVYRVNHTATSGVEIEAGIAIIKGLDSKDYYLEETQNPDGYTKLLQRQKLSITNNNLEATLNENTTTNEDGSTTTEYTYVSGGVRVINTKGNLLPETGGIGTTLFIVIGSLMVLLFGVLLVTKYRMSKMDN